MNTRNRIIVLFLTLLALAAPFSAFAADEMVRSHVVGFEMSADDGTIQPISHVVRRRFLDPKSEAELEAALAEDRANPPVEKGHIAVRALDADGKVVYRTIVEVVLQRHTLIPGEIETYSRIPKPAFTAVVPETAESISLEGWLPASRVTFDLEEVRARHGEPELSAFGITTQADPKITIARNRLNILFLGDGYQDNQNDRDAFDRDVNVVKNAIQRTKPYDQYSAFLTFDSKFIISTDRGAVHPTCAGNSNNNQVKECDPNEGRITTRRTAFDAKYCNDGAQRALVVTDSKVQTVVNSITEGDNPELVVVLVHDNPSGGTGGKIAVMATRLLNRPDTDTNPWVGYTALHEIGHLLGLSDEYDYAGIVVGPIAECGLLRPCGPNVLASRTAPALADIKWARWIDTLPVAVCTNAEQKHAQGPDVGKHLPLAQQCPNQQPGRPVGLYEGAFEYSVGGYRAELTCLMNTLNEEPEFCAPNPPHVKPAQIPAGNQPPPFCRICTDEIIRKLYEKVDPIDKILEENYSDSILHRNRLNVGNRIIIGADVLRKSGSETQTIKWFKDGSTIPEASLNGQTQVPIDGIAGQNVRYEMVISDPTTLVRDSSAQHTHGRKAKPVRMTTRSLKWHAVTAAETRATTPPSTAEATQTIEFTVPRGTKSLSLTYGVSTLEPGDTTRPGDSWNITVDYAGTSATAVTANSGPLFFNQQTIRSSVQNFVTAATVGNLNAEDGDKKIAVTVRIRNLETANFIESTIFAEVFADNIGTCGALCETCRIDPTAEGCPVPFEVRSSRMLPLTEDARDFGPGNFVSIAQRRYLDRGRHMEIVTTPLPANTSLRIQASLMTLAGEKLADLRDTTWRHGQGRGGGAQGMEQVDQTGKWKFNIAQKGDFRDPLPSIPEEKWTDAFKYHIVLTVTATDGRTTIREFDVDHFESAEPPFVRPIRALWEEPENRIGIWHKWVSIHAHRWYRQFASLTHGMDRNTDTHGAYDTPPGHEFGTAFTELPFYPGAAVWTNSSNQIYAPYLNFRADAAKLAYGPITNAEIAAKRAILATWIRETREHLTALLPNDAIQTVHLGDGSKACMHPFIRPSDALPEGWMRELLEYGRVSNNGIVFIDLTSEPGVGAAQWQFFNGRISWGCESNFWPSVNLDRCRIGEFPGPCRTGRPPGLRVTRITSQPKGSLINAGQSATLVVSADGEDLRYRWYAGPRGDFAASTQKGDAATLSVTPPETQQYWVYVWGANGSEISEAAIVEVAGTGGPCVRPKITQQPPLFTSISPDATATLTVRADGTNLRYQWYYAQSSSDTPMAIAGATSASYSTSTSGRFTVRVSNSCGEQTSVTAYIAHTTSCLEPRILGNSPDAMVKNGDSIDLFVSADGKAPLSYVWYETVPNLGTRAVGFAASVRVRPTVNGTQYTPGVSNDCKAILGSPITITVCDPPAITQQPQSKDIVRGESTTLSVATAGSTPQNVVWTNGNDASNAGFGPAITVSPQVTTTYSAQITNACGAIGSMSAVVTVCQPPSISQQPTGGTVTKGQSATLTVTATGTAPLSYQWRANGVPVGGANGASFTVTPDDTTPYSVVVTGACGTVTSNPATVTVCFPPQITQQPQNVSILPGQTATLSVQATGTGPLTYRLVDQDSNVVATGSSSTFELTPPAGTRRYRIQVVGSCGDAWSNEATVTTCQSPAITAHPQSTTIVSGDPVTLSVTATGTAPLGYQWFEGTTAIPGKTESSLTVSPETATSYSVTVTNACGTIPSDVATITVTQRCFRPIIGTQLQPATINAGQSATLTLGVSGTSPMTFRWFADGTQIATTSEASLTVTPPSTTAYHVVVSNDCGTATSTPATITVQSCGQTPSITAHPQPVTIQSGQSTTLSVTANGTAPLHYQWYANGVVIDGATSSSHTVSPTSTTSYHVVVTNACGAATSNTATVTVGTCSTPAISSHPQPVSIVSGQSTTLSVAAGGGALTYQWYANGSTIFGATSSSHTVSPASTTSYHVVVTNSCGSTTSNTATVTVSTCASPVVTSHPQSVTIFSNASTTLSVTATGQAPLSYQWYANGVAINNATGSTVTVSPNSTTAYHVAVTNACGSVNSGTATVTVVSCQPSIQSHPQSVAIGAGDSATLSVTATGSAPLHYQWFTGDGNTVSGGTSSSITVSPTADTDYYVVVSNDCGSRTSSIARVSIVSCPAPTITTQPADVTVPFRGNVTLSVVAAGQQPLSYRWYNGQSGDTSAPLFENGVPATRSSVSFQATTTTFYWVRITNACGVAESVAAKVTMLPCASPSVTQQPQSRTITSGQSATLSVVASNPNPGPLTYQWYESRGNDFPSPINGATSASITVSPSVTTAYFVHIFNDCGIASSQSAIITVVAACTPPSITSQPQGSTIDPGQSATISVGASGSASLTYQWYFASNDQPASGISSNDSLAVSPSQTTTYYAIVRNDCGEARSSNVTVTVNVPVCEAPVVTSPTAPVNQLLRIGNSRTISITATGTAPLSYQWYRSEPETEAFEPITNATAASVTVRPEETSRYFCRVSNACGNVDSPQFRIVVWDGIGDPPDPDPVQ